MESSKPQIFFEWMTDNIPNALKVKDSKVTCNSSIGPYKNIYGNYPLFPNGKYYFEILIIKGVYFKIGIADPFQIPKDFKGAFSDTPFGFAYYSQGFLRHNSDRTGIEFGQGYGVSDVVAVLVDRCKGTVCYRVNDKEIGSAFKLKSDSVYYPAVACLIKGEEFALKLSARED